MTAEEALTLAITRVRKEHDSFCLREALAALEELRDQVRQGFK